MDSPLKERNPEVVVYAEIRPKLNVAQLNICFQDEDKSNVKLKISKNAFIVDFIDKELKYQLVFDDLLLNPSQVHTMKWIEGEGFHVRLKVDKIVIPEISHKRIFDIEMSDDSIIRVRCNQCDNMLSEVCKSRMFDLPSFGWNEMSDMFFCCSHNHESNEKEHVSIPIDDCYVSTLSFLFNGNSMKSSISFNGRLIQCTRCRNKLGIRKKMSEFGNEEVSMIFVNRIEINDIYDNTVLQYHLESITSKYFADLIDSQNGPKFMIEVSKNEGKSSTRLLMWIMDANLPYYSGSSICSKFAVQTSTYIKPAVMMKILYLDCNKPCNKIISDMWRKDFSVTSISLPDFIVADLINLLLRNTLRLPHSNRLCENFIVSYLNRI